MPATTAAEFFQRTCPRRIVKVLGLDSWGLSLWLRSLTAREKDEFERSVLDDDFNKVDSDRLMTAKARLLSLTLCDESGQLLFTAAQIEGLRDTDAKVIELIHRQAETLVGFNRQDLETLVKNSEAVRAACSPTNYV